MTKEQRQIASAITSKAKAIATHLEKAGWPNSLHFTVMMPVTVPTRTWYGRLTKKTTLEEMRLPGTLLIRDQEIAIVSGGVIVRKVYEYDSRRNLTVDTKTYEPLYLNLLDTYDLVLMNATVSVVHQHYGLSE